MGWRRQDRHSKSIPEKRKRPQALDPPGMFKLPPVWQALRADARFGPALARLENDRAMGILGEIDTLRIDTALRAVVQDPDALADLAGEIRVEGGAAAPHMSGERDLPLRRARHALDHGAVCIGQCARDARNPLPYRGMSFALDTDVLRTSLLVVGPPGSGKTSGFAFPVAEHLSLQALAGRASLVVIDPKGDDFAGQGWFDIEIDPANPSNGHGFDLYGGAETPEEAADRLADALLPPGVSADKAYFLDASKNALYGALAPYVVAHDGKYPSLHKLLALLSGDTALLTSVRDRLANRGLDKQYGRFLESRRVQLDRREDPAASLLERLSLLDRPNLVELFDRRRPRFAMRQINGPVRVHISLPEGRYPEASRIIARLAVSQFVQAASAPNANRRLFKALICDEAGRYVDEYVARGIQRLRSNNAGLVLLTQSLGDIPEDLLRTIFGSAGCKAVFGGIDPDDARHFSEWWGEHQIVQRTVSHGTSTGAGTIETEESLGDRHTVTTGRSAGVSVRYVEHARWTPSDIITAIPPGYTLLSLTRSNGIRTPPLLVNLRV